MCTVGLSVRCFSFTSLIYPLSHIPWEGFLQQTIFFCSDYWPHISYSEGNVQNLEDIFSLGGKVYTSVIVRCTRSKMETITAYCKAWHMSLFVFLVFLCLLKYDCLSFIAIWALKQCRFILIHLQCNGNFSQGERNYNVIYSKIQKHFSRPFSCDIFCNFSLLPI